jgi:hypothetical protein
VSNASNVSDLSGPFRTYSFNYANGLRALSLQLSLGHNAAGQLIWEASYGGPLGPYLTGGGFGLSFSGYNTNTVTRGGGQGKGGQGKGGQGCGCK